MAIKFVVLRSHDGHAMDVLRPDAKVKAGVGGVVEVLTQGDGKTRVSVNGIELEGHPAKWPDDLATSEATVVVEQIAGDTIVDTKTGKVEVTGLPPAESKPAAPVAPAAKLPAVEQPSNDAHDEEAVV